MGRARPDGPVTVMADKWRPEENFRPKQQPYADRAVIARMVQWRRRGLTYQQIADRLELEGVPSQRGGTWQRATVMRILRRETGTEDGCE